MPERVSDERLEQLMASYAGWVDGSAPSHIRDKGREMHAILAELQALRREREWRPMIDAPTSRPILLDVPDYGVGSGFWQTYQTVNPLTDVIVEHAGWRVHGMLIERSWGMQPRAWLPLPEPPHA